MDDLLLLIIFSYPGAISDMVYTSLAKDMSFYKEPAAVFRVARGCFISALVAFVTMRLTIPQGCGAHTLQNWIDLLKKSEIIWTYMLYALIISICVGVFWFCGAMICLWFRNWLSSIFEDLLFHSFSKTSWKDIVQNYNKLHLGETVVVVRNAEDRIVCCGIPYGLPDEIDKDAAIALMWCDRVKQELQKEPEHTEIKGDTVTYFDMKTGYRIEFRKAADFVNSLRKKKK